MGLHQCPIEPDDWSNGPDDPEDKPCPDCENGRVNRENCTIDGIKYPAIVDQECETCKGLGYIPYDPTDFYEDYPNYED